MGRIVRRFARFFEQELRGNLEQGVWGTGIAQYEAGQVLRTAVLDATALGGDVAAGYFGVSVSVAMTGTPRAMRLRMTIEDGVVVTGSTFGLHIEQEVLGAGEHTVDWEGIRLEMYGEGASVHTGPIIGMFISNFIQNAPLSNYWFFNLTENGGVTVEAAFRIAIGGAGDITNLFILAGTETAWDANTIPPGAVIGRVAVQVAGVQRYLALWN